MRFRITHRTRGRVRISLPDRPAASRLRTIVLWLEQQPEVLEARANAGCASIAIVSRGPDTHALDVLLARLAGIRVLPRAPDARPTTQVEPTKPPHTLIAAAISLALSTIGGGAFGLASGALAAYAAVPSVLNARSAWQRRRQLNVDFLDSLAVALSVVRGAHPTAALMVSLLRLGDEIRDRTAARSRRMIEGLLDYQTRRCWVVREGRKVDTPVSQVRSGDMIVVYAGGSIVVDGRVASGVATVDQRSITGESLPVEKRKGDNVYAGTALHEGSLYVTATAVGNDTTVASIVAMVEERPVGETRIQNYAERFADRLVVPTLALGGGLYALTGNVEQLLSTLMVDFGTGIRVAAPTTVLASIVAAARRGVVIKSGSVIEKLSSADAMIFDKTGTITRGRPVILDIVSYDERRFPARKLLAIAAGADARIHHPIAEAVAARARQDRVVVPGRDHSRFTIGRGVAAQINGWRVAVGNERFMLESGIGVKVAAADLRRCAKAGYSALFVAIDDELKGLIPYEDEIRPEMPHVVRALERRGFEQLWMVTGDNAAVASAVARRVGLKRFVSDVMPGQKAEIINSQRSSGHVVAMVGDGVNDAPALAHADVGIAVRNGTDLAQNVANVVLMDDNMSKLVTAIDVSRTAVGIIRQNFAIIAALNAIALALALPSKAVSPGAIALISNGSAILASLNAMRPLFDKNRAAGPGGGIRPQAKSTLP